ncbi:RelA/SpoT family protein [Pantoea agglomerans]
MYNPEDIIARRIHDAIESELTRTGLLFRVFFRAKTKQSIENKINNNPGKYSVEGKKIQDIYGIRVAFYFSDDSILAQNAIKNIFTYDHESSSIDSNKVDKFAATRCNLIFKLPEDLVEESQVLSTNELVDKTFEVQFRTILSEGWHEVDHDLRYKCNEDWIDNQDLSRALNGIYASLETSDWSMLKLFEDLAYKHYKGQKWNAMIRHKFRLRFTGALSENIAEIISTQELGKKVYRINRDDFLRKIFTYQLNIPINMNNIIYLCNLFYLQNEEIQKLTPQPIVTMYEEALEKFNT